jgi:hypothetical protein
MGRVAPRRLRIREGLRLRARQGYLVRRQTSEGEQAGRRTYYRRCGAAGRTDLLPGGEGRHGAGVSAKGGLDRCVVANKERVVLELLRERELASALKRLWKT